jgi:anti-sigma factor RsiW
VCIEQHLAGCVACEALRRSMESVRTTVASEATYHRLTPLRRAALLGTLDREILGTGEPRNIRARRARGSWQYWAGAASGAVAAAVVAGSLLLLMPRPETSAVVNDLVGAHVRSLLSNHLIDVESTDRHTVKPWFAGHVDVSPPVADFAQQDYRLVGGRVDYVDGRRAAVVVYRHGPHTINVFAWPDSGTRLPTRIVARNGYHLVFWKSGSLAFCAVSDTAVDELLGLTRLLEAMTVADGQE